MIKKCLFGILLFSLGCTSTPLRSPSATESSSPFSRKYVAGKTLSYRIQMTHFKDGSVTSTYDTHVTGIVKSDSNGFYEEFQWTSVNSDGKKIALPLEVTKFRQVLSLAPPFRLAIPPELTQLGRFMIGPITDFLTFYVDQSLAIRQPSIQSPGNHAYFNSSVVSSFGSGQDCLDFEVTYLGLDQANQVGTIKVSHLPPAKICIKPPAKWMETQVADMPNNWFDIEHDDPKKWVASAGKEIFDVIQKSDLATGEILSATMDNPVVFESRECSDAQFTNCSAPTSHKIVRQVVFTRE